MKNIIRLWQYYLQNAMLRNSTAILFDISFIVLMCLALYKAWVMQNDLLNYFVLLLYIGVAIICKKAALILRVTRICPQCLENRGVVRNVQRTGNVKNYREYISGDYWRHEQEAEYLLFEHCTYCAYENFQYYWQTESWRGELTEEARIKRNAEELRRIETQARIDAYEEIKRRNSGKYY